MLTVRFTHFSLGALIAFALVACTTGRSSRPRDSGAVDSGVTDSSAVDSNAGDSSTPDGSATDSSTSDSALPDTGPADSAADASICAAPTIECSGTCVDPRSDDLNCGSCGMACTAAEECLSTSCTALCTGPTPDRCGTDCVDLISSRMNCGTCGTVCAASDRCSAGACTMGGVDSVLIFYDTFTAGDVPSEVAAIRMGATRVVAESDAAAFASQYDGTTWDVVVVSVAGGGLPSDVQTRAISRAAAREPLIFSWWDLDSDASLQAALGVSVTSYSTPFPLYPTAGAPVNLFSTVETFPAPLTNSADFSDNGDILNPTGAASILVSETSPTGANIIVRTNAGTTVINGFLLSDYQDTDGDGDGIPDVVELMVNELSMF